MCMWLSLDIFLKNVSALDCAVRYLGHLPTRFKYISRVWNNKIGPQFYFVGSRAEVMIDRDSWGPSYLTVKGEILGFVKDGQLRKHLPGCFH